MKKLLILGAHNPEIIRLIHTINAKTQANIEIMGFLDNDPSKKNETILGYPVIGTPHILKSKKYHNCYVSNNITRDPKTRKETTRQLLAYTNKFLTLIHPSVDLTYVKIGKGTIIYEGCIVSPNVCIGNHCTLMIHSTIAHDSSVGNYCFFAPHSVLNGHVSIGNECSIGSGAIILPRISIGNNVSIGAGSVIGENIPNNLFVMGNPSRAIPIHSKL